MTRPGEHEAHRKHRCMRCGGEFECHAEGCAAGYDVLPTRVERGPDGTMRVVEHECELPKESGWKEIAHGVYEKPTESECAPDYDTDFDPPPEVIMPRATLERVIRALESHPGEAESGLAISLRALASPAAAPAAEREPEIVEGCEHNPPHLRMRPPSEPAAPAPDWSVRAGDKCTRVGCDKRVVAACLPHQFGGCDEHMREHDSRCTFAPLDRTASPVAQGKEKG